MRTNLTGFALTVGMGLIVLLLGFLSLSATGLAGFSAEETLAAQAAPEEFGCGVIATPIDSSANVKVVMTPVEQEGAALFKANCAQCHAVHGQVVGPALANITKRRPISWIVPWVQNSAKVVANGDEYAVKLFNDNGKQQMPSFNLTKREIEAIVAWIDSPAGNKDKAGSYTIQD
jgi:mono/diheme cytochrome c family protein